MSPKLRHPAIHQCTRRYLLVLVRRAGEVSEALQQVLGLAGADLLVITNKDIGYCANLTPYTSISWMRLHAYLKLGHKTLTRRSLVLPAAGAAHSKENTRGVSARTKI
jgi:hypothetical protein